MNTVNDTLQNCIQESNKEPESQNIKLKREKLKKIELRLKELEIEKLSLIDERYFLNEQLNR
ncbi:hypothetical protein [Chengkuizengella marina]|uniref:Uncharacterized protein n=1 Tax=Chengkuizengella marina TaxID=2507566 RepID=A0A6N9Q8L8_9BACL|nr:hypothetical protein [Chengkuizengella marina]NBI30993.1 hypothetical protein [Chengkuizengella marina]